MYISYAHTGKAIGDILLFRWPFSFPFHAVDHLCRDSDYDGVRNVRRCRGGDVHGTTSARRPVAWPLSLRRHGVRVYERVNARERQRERERERERETETERERERGIERKRERDREKTCVFLLRVCVCVCVCVCVFYLVVGMVFFGVPIEVWGGFD